MSGPRRRRHEKLWGGRNVAPAAGRRQRAPRQPCTEWLDWSEACGFRAVPDRVRCAVAAVSCAGAMRFAMVIGARLPYYGARAIGLGTRYG